MKKVTEAAPYRGAGDRRIPKPKKVPRESRQISVEKNRKSSWTQSGVINAFFNFGSTGCLVAFLLCLDKMFVFQKAG